MLCKNCEYRQRVESSEVGVVFDRCTALKTSIGSLGNVTKCSEYAAKDLPYLFSRQAWKMDKNAKGEWEFINPQTGKPFRRKKVKA